MTVDQQVVQQQVIPEEIRALTPMADPDYVDLFTLSSGVPGRSPERWARLMLGDIGGRGAQFVWRGLLGLRLKTTPERVAGWRVADRGDNWIRVEASSWFMTGHIVVEADDDHVSLATFIRYDRAVAAVVWSFIARVHRRAALDMVREAYRLPRPEPR